MFRKKTEALPLHSYGHQGMSLASISPSKRHVLNGKPADYLEVFKVFGYSVKAAEAQEYYKANPTSHLDFENWKAAQLIIQENEAQIAKMKRMQSKLCQKKFLLPLRKSLLKK